MQRRSAKPDPIVVQLLPETFAICRLGAEERIPSWATRSRGFWSATRTPTELSIVTEQSAVPTDVFGARDYRALRLEGPMPLDLVGVLAAVIGPLAQAGISVFPIATYDTDYILVPEKALERTIGALAQAGHRVASNAEAE